MREVFETINDYPWTTFFCWWMIVSCFAVLGANFNSKDK